MHISRQCGYNGLTGLRRESKILSSGSLTAAMIHGEKSPRVNTKSSPKRRPLAVNAFYPRTELRGRLALRQFPVPT